MTPPDELDPVRAELLRAARAAAGAAVRGARAEAAQTLRAARADAERVLAQARELGAGDGRAVAARERVQAAEDAWSRELAARAEVYAELRAEVRAGVRRALADGAAPPLTPAPGTGPPPPVSGSELPSVSAVRLADVARAVLGPEARISAAPGGGITADVPGRHLDLSADTLADRALERMGDRIECLWGGP
ncbi:hypothetical protein ACIRQQ_39735 [Streptomyces fuscichromogenes]|uniref:hypothetical protein n=1 Tax=Streptomyces fuscichromogenes TaxID=1324013 RepID=UPI00380357C3